MFYVIHALLGMNLGVMVALRASLRKPARRARLRETADPRGKLAEA
jgi:hypothetical protein